MSYKLLTRKLSLEDRKIIESSLIKEYCDKLGMDYYPVIRYLTSNKHLIRILKGIFYKVSLEERKFGKLDMNYLEAIDRALDLKKIKNRYFGLETAMKLNNMTHEYFVTDYILNDKIFREKAIDIMGHKIKFVKIKKSLFDFGIIKDKVPYSDAEKTILDIIYLSKYNGLSDGEIKNRIIGVVSYASKKKLSSYSKRYNKKVHDFIRGFI